MHESTLLHPLKIRKQQLLMQPAILTLLSTLCFRRGPECSDDPPRFPSDRIGPYDGRLLPVRCPARNPDLRDHNLIRWLASCELLELEAGRPAVRLRPLVTVGDRSCPCGPGAPRTQHGPRVRSRPVADASGAPVLRDQGPIGRPGTARPMQASTNRPPASKARSGRIVTCEGGERRRSRPLWCCPWLSARDRSGLL